MNVRFSTRYLGPADEAPPPGGEAPPAAPPSSETPPPAGDSAANGGEPPVPPAGTTPPSAQKWPDAWREEMAGTLSETATDEEKAEHDKLLKRLKRFNSPADAAKTIREQDKLIPTLKKPLGKNATPEQIAEWRKDNGIPEAPEKYELGLPEGTVVGDNDKPIIDAALKAMHGANAQPEVVKAGVNAFFKAREEMVQAAQVRNAEAKRGVEDALRAEWGQDYRNNVAGVDSLLSNADSSVVEAIMSSRMPDGVQLLNKPEVIKWLAGHARELGFVGGTVVTNGGDVAKSVEDELTALNQEMAKDADAWAKNAKGQKRWMELHEAKDRLSKARK